MARATNQKPKGITAWLVTWEHIGEHVAPPYHIAAILNYRWSAERVREYVELLYVNNSYSFEEHIAYAKNKSFNPYPAEFERIHGVPWEGRITCGHNPFLCARLVDNLVAGGDSCDEAQVTWDERPRPGHEKIARLLDKERGS